MRLFGGRGDNMFSTHPNTDNRIAALQAIAAEMGAPAIRRRASALDPLGPR